MSGTARLAVTESRVVRPQPGTSALIDADHGRLRSP